MASMQPLPIMMAIFLGYLWTVSHIFNPVNCINFFLTIYAFWYCLSYLYVMLSSLMIIEIA